MFEKFDKFITLKNKKNSHIIKMTSRKSRVEKISNPPILPLKFGQFWENPTPMKREVATISTGTKLKGI